MAAFHCNAAETGHHPLDHDPSEHDPSDHDPSDREEEQPDPKISLAGTGYAKDCIPPENDCNVTVVTGGRGE